MNKRRVGIVLVVIGAVLILSALLLFAYNKYEDAHAGSEAQDILTDVQDAITEGGETGLANAEDGETPMPVMNIDGYDYIGYLNVPDLKLELPVMADWDYTRLKKAPCRHMGSVYDDNLVVAAHNYQRHFGRLKELPIGAEVTFTDVNGQVIAFTVAEHFKVGPYDVDLVLDSEYDLVLYTCTYSGNARTAVGCNRAE